MVQTTTLGEDFNTSIFSTLIGATLPEEAGFSLFPAYFKHPVSWGEVTVRKQEQDFLLQVPNASPIILTLDSKGRVSSISFVLPGESSWRLNFQKEHFTGKVELLDSANTPLYHISFEGTYGKPQDTLQASLHVSSLNITDEEGTFYVNFYGDLTLGDKNPTTTLLSARATDLFAISQGEARALSQEILINLQTSPLQPLLPYFGF